MPMRCRLLCIGLLILTSAVGVLASEEVMLSCIGFLSEEH